MKSIIYVIFFLLFWIPHQTKRFYTIKSQARNWSRAMKENNKFTEVHYKKSEALPCSVIFKGLREFDVAKGSVDV